jgi:hypothetical protein
MLEYKRLENSDLPALQEFCRVCEQNSNFNNASFASLKLQIMQPPFGQYWLVKEKSSGLVVGISGCHHFPEISEQTYRILYRSCLLQDFRVHGIKNLFRNITVNEPIFKNLAPLQIRWAKEQGGRNFIITTNSVKDEKWKEKMLQMNRVLKLMEKQQIVSLMHENMEIYHCLQNVWLLNEEKLRQDRARAGLETVD